MTTKARAINSGTISFGLVSIPIKVYTAAADERVEFNLVHGSCASRLRQQYVCSACTEEDGKHPLVVPQKEQRRACQHARDQYVTLADDELAKLESPRLGELEIHSFVPEKSVDLVSIKRSYYLGPDKGGSRAYALLAQELRAAGLIGVGQDFHKTRDELVLVRPFKSGLILHQAFYATEVRDFDDIDMGEKVTLSETERRLAAQLIRQRKEAKFDPSQFVEQYRARVEDAVQTKVAGREIALATERPKAEVIELAEALKRSVAAAKGGRAQGGPKKANRQSTPPGGQRKAG